MYKFQLETEYNTCFQIIYKKNSIQSRNRESRLSNCTKKEKFSITSILVIENFSFLVQLDIFSFVCVHVSADRRRRWGGGGMKRRKCNCACASAVSCYQWIYLHHAAPLNKRKSDTRFLTSGFFHEAVNPGSLEYPILGQLHMYTTICGDIHNKVQWFWNVG